MTFSNITDAQQCMIMNPLSEFSQDLCRLYGDEWRNLHDRKSTGMQFYSTNARYKEDKCKVGLIACGNILPGWRRKFLLVLCA